MNFISMEVQNFLSIADCTFDFDTGLVLITGTNLDAPKADSNGAGKSTLLEAIVWCLWGETIRGLKADKVVNRKIGKNCKVKLYLEDEGTKYEVVRYRKYKQDKPNDLRVFAGGKEISQGSMSTTQKKVDALLGMDRPTFCALMPGAGIKVAGLTDKSVKQLLESILRTEDMAMAHSIAVDRRKAVRAKLEQETTAYDFLMKGKSGTESRIKDYTNSLNNFKENQKGKTDAVQERLDAKIDKRIALTKDISALDKGIALERRMLDKKAVLQAKKVSTSFRVSVEEAKYDAAFLEYSTQDGTLVAEIDFLNSLPELTGDHAECPMCSSECGPDVLKEQEDKRAARKQELGAQRAALVLPSEEARTEAEAASYTIYKALTALDKKFDQLKLAKATRVQKKKELVGIAKDVLDLKQQLHDTEDEVNPFESLLKQEKKELKAVLKREKELKKVLEELKTQEERLSFWVDGFSPQGLRSYMLNNVVPVLNKRAEYYCSLLTNDELAITFHTQTELKSGKVAEKFDIQVEYAHGADSWEGSSAGEKSRADLIIALCLGDLAAMRSQKKISFRFMDEPFENIDEAGVEAVSNLLHNQIKEYPSIYVITHKSAFAQMFTKKITMIKENGLTRIENG